MTVQLATIGQFKDTLTDLDHSAINLIKKEANRRFTSGFKPVWRVPRCTVIVKRRQTNKITLSHLRSATFHNGKITTRSGLIDHLRLTHTVATTDQNRQTGIKDRVNDRKECGEIDLQGDLRGLCCDLSRTDTLSQK